MKLEIIVVALAASLSLQVFASSSPQRVTAPASAFVSSDTRNEALAGGVDLDRMSTAPGVYIVPLADSPYTGDVALQIQREIAMRAADGLIVTNEMPRSAVQSAAQAPLSALAWLFEASYPSLEAVRPQLHFEPASVEATALAQAEFKEAYPSGALSGRRWTGVTRVWRAAGLGEVKLSEFKHKRAGAAITVVREWINAEVAGTPAILKTQVNAAGQVQASIAWVTPTTSYRLELSPVATGDIKANEEALLAVANGLAATD